MLMAIFMMVIGKMTKLMGLENTLTQMAPSMKVNGSTISNTAKEKKSGRMVLNTKAIINLVKKTVLANSCGLIDHLMREILSIIISMAMENTNGPTEENLLEIGSAIRCMDAGTSVGLMVGSTRATTTMTRSRAMEYLRGRTVASIMELG